MTLGAALFTLPVVVWLAGGISVIAPLGNLVAGMTLGLFLVPAAVLIDSASLCQWIPVGPLVGFWVRAADLVFRLMAQMADLPISFMHLSPKGCLTATLAGVAGILIWRRKGYRPGQGMVVFLAILVLSASVKIISENTHRKELVITFPGVGQADAALIRHEGLTVLVDCGPEGTPGRDSPVARTLQWLGIREIDAIFLSHRHPDHAGALEEIMTRWPVRFLYLSQDHTLDRQQEGFTRRTLVPPTVRILHQGDVVEHSFMTFTVLGPDGVKGAGGDVNRRSQQVLLKVNDFGALFTGDAGWDQVQLSLGRIESLNLIKLPHHGSKKNFPPDGFDKAISRVAENGKTIAVCPSRPPGRGSLPAPEVVKWFEERGIKLVYTGDNGINIIHKKGSSMGPGSTVVDNNDWF
jgi:competence protein ComEC